LAPDDEHADEDHEEGHDHDHADEHDHDEDGHEGHDHIEGFNEHVWYDFHTVEKVAKELSHELGELDSDNADVYESNYEAFAEKIEQLEKSAAELKTTADGRGAAITEPVPLYLL